MGVAYKTTNVTSRNRQDPMRLNGRAKSTSKSLRTSDRVIPMPNAKKPLWLLRLNSLQRRSSAIAFCLVAAMLAIYGGTVYAERTSLRERQQLETLQRRERQLTITTEVLKSKMAQQAEQPDNELVPPDATKTIVLKPAPQRPNRTPEMIISSTHKSQPKPNPVGY